MHYQLFGSKRICVRGKYICEMTSILRPPVNEIFAAYISNYFPSHFQNSSILCLTLEDGTNMLSRNVGSLLPIMLRNITEERGSDFGDLKSSILYTHII